MKRLRKIRPKEYFEKRHPDRRLTRQRIGKVFADLRGKGLVCSAPVDTPPHMETVWVRKDDPYAPLFRLSAGRKVIAQNELWQIAHLADKVKAAFRELARLGVAVVPNGDDRVRLVGTCPTLARYINRYYHGRRPRRLTRRALISIVKDIESNGRKVARTPKRILDSLEYVEREFDADFTDLIDHDSILF